MKSLVFQSNDSTIIIEKEGTRRKAIIMDDGRKPYSRFLPNKSNGVSNLFKVRGVHVIVE